MGPSAPYWWYWLACLVVLIAFAATRPGQVRELVGHPKPKELLTGILATAVPAIIITTLVIVGVLLHGGRYAVFAQPVVLAGLIAYLGCPALVFATRRPYAWPVLVLTVALAPVFLNAAMQALFTIVNDGP